MLRSAMLSFRANFDVELNDCSSGTIHKVNSLILEDFERHRFQWHLDFVKIGQTNALSFFFRFTPHFPEGPRVPESAPPFVEVSLAPVTLRFRFV